MKPWVLCFSEVKLEKHLSKKIALLSDFCSVLRELGLGTGIFNRLGVRRVLIFRMDRNFLKSP